MKLIFLAVFLATGVVGLSAQTPAETLGQCLSDSTTGKDRQMLAQWVTIGVLKHPAMADLTVVTPAKAEQINKNAAGVLQRLISVDCKTEFKAALKGGSQAIEVAFGKLGEIAMNEITNHPEVNKAFNGLPKYLDVEKLTKAMQNP